MLALETVAGIRNDHFRDKVPIKAIARKRGISRNTAGKAVREGPEAFGSVGKRQPKPKLGPWIGELERMLAESAELPKRERPTLTRIHEDPASLGCKAGYDSVRRHAAAWRERQAAEAPREAHVPLVFDPGEAFQFDWSIETVVLAGTPVTVKAAHFRLCHSRMAFVRPCRRESLGCSLTRTTGRSRSSAAPAAGGYTTT